MNLHMSSMYLPPIVKTSDPGYERYLLPTAPDSARLSLFRTSVVVTLLIQVHWTYKAATGTNTSSTFGFSLTGPQMKPPFRTDSGSGQNRKRKQKEKCEIWSSSDSVC